MNHSLEKQLRLLIRKKTREVSRKEWLGIQSRSDSPIYDYRFNHVNEVVMLTKHLSKKSNAEREVTILASWLHDIAKPGIDGPKQHGKKSSQKARKILSEMDIEETMIRKVCDIIEKHVGLTLEQPLEPLEAQLLWEADKLSKLGATGIIHYIINGIRLKPGMSLQDISEDLSDFMSLAEEIADSMHTEKAKEIASKRFNTMKSFVKSLEQEVQRREK
jgi:uncharacterized protein